MAVVKVYKIRKYRISGGRKEFVIRVPLEFMYNAKFPERVRIVVDGDKMIVTPA